MSTGEKPKSEVLSLDGNRDVSSQPQALSSAPPPTAPTSPRVLPAVGSDTHPGMLIRDRRGKVYYIEADGSYHRIPNAIIDPTDESVTIPDPDLSAHISRLRAKYGEV